MKTYVMTVSESFLKSHPRNGQNTDFVNKIESLEKIHTVRGNYQWWENVIFEVNSGKACLSLRIWTGRPYRSPQKELRKYYKLALEALVFDIKNTDICHVFNREMDRNNQGRMVEIDLIAKNDGLSRTDFDNWFGKPDYTGIYAIIHFTAFTYNTGRSWKMEIPYGWVSIEQYLPVCTDQDFEMYGCAKFRVKYSDGIEDSSDVVDSGMWYHAVKELGVTHWWNTKQ